MKLVFNERCGGSTFYNGIHEFLKCLCPSTRHFDPVQKVRPMDVNVVQDLVEDQPFDVFPNVFFEHFYETVQKR